MKMTPEEKRLQHNFLPGILSKDGFLGQDTRHIHDIIQDDQRQLEALGFSAGAVADRLQFFMKEGRKGLELPVLVGDHRVEVRWQRGMLACPFGDPGLHPKIITTVTHQPTGRTIRYSQLSVHLIRRHGFFGGKGSVFRLEPGEIVSILGVPISNNQQVP